MAKKGSVTLSQVVQRPTQPKLHKGKGKAIEVVPQEDAMSNLSEGDSDDLSEDGEHGAAPASDVDDEEEIGKALAKRRAQTQSGSSKKKKRKVLDPEEFGASLQALLSAAPLSSTKSNRVFTSLKPIHESQAETNQARKALKQVQQTRHQVAERGHVSDLIADWRPRPQRPFSQWTKKTEGDLEQEELGVSSAEQEKALRRLAQKGVVRLFNAVRAAQGVDQAHKPKPGLGAPAATPRIAATAATATPAIDTDHRRANLLGSRGREDALANLSKDTFLQLIKSGGANIKV
ncbi:uncharacterized protein L969DRAFT_256279 [Mixia osmundae IAM 14324]|uniref:Rrp15p-domain-containing protein n=1 Tax=Mixia osmundae (strain CBS 9802 / IAM 14324 / JCM 22182 / KY 12970) TaxID=764103 RepID=G7DW27_MIXOS|nr:uncharacterized protein L969DRAFT_256279 [Mixia osmundae IAM 14324]KEI36467.1 hypothetical protein L969DRAFT_256279 [Mixia osmundae IAM 14324]GAA94833.1 hypothetical protein E5Q_01487 [Mixia osmundae IAM 14324]